MDLHPITGPKLERVPPSSKESADLLADLRKGEAYEDQAVRARSRDHRPSRMAGSDRGSRDALPIEEPDGS